MLRFLQERYSQITFRSCRNEQCASINKMFSAAASTINWCMHDNLWTYAVTCVLLCPVYCYTLRQPATFEIANCTITQKSNKADLIFKPRKVLIKLLRQILQLICSPITHIYTHPRQQAHTHNEDALIVPQKFNIFTWWHNPKILRLGLWTLLSHGTRLHLANEYVSICISSLTLKSNDAIKYDSDIVVTNWKMTLPSYDHRETIKATQLSTFRV